MPTVTISTPARAGPTTRALLTTTPLRLTALARSSGGTRRLTKAWRAGESAIWTTPARHADGHQGRHAGLARGGQRPQQRGQEAIERLGDQEELAQVDPVGHRPAPGAEQQRGDPPGRQHQPQVAGRTGELEDEPADGRLLQEGAAGRDDLAAEVEAEGLRPQGAKRAAGAWPWAPL